MRHARFVYNTKIPEYTRGSLETAAEEARARSQRCLPDTGLGYAYRVNEAVYSTVVDADREEYGTTSHIEIIAWPIVKQTERGFRIRLGGFNENPETTWVTFAHTKQFASLTPEGALRDFIARRKKQASIYEARANTARRYAERAERILGKMGLV